MSKRRYIFYLEDIEEAINNVFEYTEDYSIDCFFKKIKKQSMLFKEIFPSSEKLPSIFQKKFSYRIRKLTGQLLLG